MGFVRQSVTESNLLYAARVDVITKRCRQTVWMGDALTRMRRQKTLVAQLSCIVGLFCIVVLFPTPPLALIALWQRVSPTWPHNTTCVTGLLQGGAPVSRTHSR